MRNAAVIHSSNGLLLNNSNLGFGADEAVYNNVSIIPFNRKVEFVHIIIYIKTACLCFPVKLDLTAYSKT